MFHRRGTVLQRRLTQLYNDTKQSYESAKIAPASPSFEDDPGVKALRREFQIQQDRLLAWGMHWAEKNAAQSQGGHGEKSGLHQDVEIDKKIDQAGLGDVVAEVMENIKNLLDESGRLQHPGRWREHQNARSGGRAALLKEKFGGSTSPRVDKQEWKDYEVQTGRVLLERLTNSIEILYDLTKAHKEGAGEDEGKGNVKESDASRHSSSNVRDVKEAKEFKGDIKKKVTVEEMMGALASDPASAGDLADHHLYIDFNKLEPMHDSSSSTEPPSYDDVRENTATPARSIYYYSAKQVHVLVDLVKVVGDPNVGAPDDPLRRMHELSDKMSGKGLLTWDGHFKVLGFTRVISSSRFGVVYALPAPNDPTALQQYQTLTTTIAATYEHDAAMPPLENKFRMAYNLALTATGYLAHNECHGQIKSSNVIFLRENDNPRLGAGLRTPYLLQPVQRLTGLAAVHQPLSATIYHYPDVDEVGSGTVPAYDVYSIGLMLLEIGLWMPLTKFWKPKYDRVMFSERLRKVYTPKLASKCGTRYMKLVQKLMDAPTALYNKSSPIDAAEYLLSVVEDMAKCCALDENGPPTDLDIDVFEALFEEQRRVQPEPLKANTPSAVVDQSPLPTPGLAPATKAGPTRAKQKPEKGAVRKFPDLDIPQDHLDQWNTMLMPRFSKILKAALQDSLESCSVSLMMCGNTPEQAKTTICVQCRDTGKVKDALFQRFRPKRGWGLVVCPGDVRRSGQIRRTRPTSAKRSGAGTASTGSGRPRRNREQLYQPRPGCGASIGAFKDEEHLPPVSFGGTIIVDGEPFGMTVHHMLDEPSSDEDGDDEEADAVDENPRRSTARVADLRLAEIDADLKFIQSEDVLPTFDGIDISDPSSSEAEDLEVDGDSDTSTIRPDYAMMDEDGDEFWFMDDGSEGSAPALDEGFSSGSDGDDDDDDDADAGSVGDKPGFAPDTFDEEEMCITQPAIDDVDDDFFPCLEDRDDDHLASHSFGVVHASSGIRRVVKHEMKHEVDWALIRVNGDRLGLNATPALTRRTSSNSSKVRAKRPNLSEPSLTAITPLHHLSKLSVTSIGRTSGLCRGRISQALSLVKFHGRSSFSSSYTVEGGFGVPGDSGAWVFNEERQELCGHILAWGSGIKCAFMAPMEVLFDDLMTTLEAREVTLPAAQRVQRRPPPPPPLQTRGVQPPAPGHAKGKCKEVVHSRPDSAGSDTGSAVGSAGNGVTRTKELEVALTKMRRDAAAPVVPVIVSVGSDSHGPEAASGLPGGLCDAGPGTSRPPVPTPGPVARAIPS